MILYQKLHNEIVNHRYFWNYYDNNFEDILKTESSAKAFIRNYFKSGSKLAVLDEWNYCSSKEQQMRNVHTVNVFFIGAMLQRMIDENVYINSKTSFGYPFSYIWYLACLAHDFGYVYENYSKAYLSLKTKNNQYCQMISRGENIVIRKIWYMHHGMDIPYVVPDFGDKCCWRREHLSGDIEYNNGTVIRKPRYSNKEKNKYFYYRIDKMMTLDHGIVGADELFSKLVINYIKEYRVVASQNYFEGTFDNFYNEKGLHFCSEQFKIFAYIADCVAAHNVYMAENNETSKREYVKYSLESLLSENFEKISYDNNPLLFILCVADTIEPSKKFKNYNNVELLNQISMDYNVMENFLQIEIARELYNSQEGREYVQNLQKLSDWCEIHVRTGIL